MTPNGLDSKRKMHLVVTHQGDLNPPKEAKEDALINENEIKTGNQTAKKARTSENIDLDHIHVMTSDPTADALDH